MKNYLKAIRKKKGLTQRQLAESTHTSQQQIQRIESGVQTVRLDLATSICAILDEPLTAVFPKTYRPIQKELRRAKSDSKSLDLHKLHDELLKAGIETDPLQYFIKYRIRGGVTNILALTGPVYKNLYVQLQNRPDETSFVTFNSGSSVFLLNLNHLQYCHFLWEAPRIYDRKYDEKDACSLNIFLAGDTEPLKFDIEPDTEIMSADCDDEKSTQLQRIIFDAEYHIPQVDDSRFIIFDDIDGETVFIKWDDIAMLSFPLSYMCPDLYEAEMEGLGEDEE